MVRKARLTPYQMTKLRLLKEIVADGLNPLTTTVVMGGLEIKFTPEDIARFYAIEGGNYSYVTMHFSKEAQRNEDDRPGEPEPEYARPAVYPDPLFAW